MRNAEIKRKTLETDVSIKLDLDGSGQYSINTSIPFLDHMLNLMAKHGLLDIDIIASGDTNVDYHHLIEDIGLTLGAVINKASGDRAGIKRYGHAVIPMDETLAEVVIDMGGRPYLVYEPMIPNGRIMDIEISIFEDFFRALSNNAMMNLHIMVRHGRDLHHIYEGIFKAFGRALDDAMTLDSRVKGLPTTKGMI
ncbi:MAG: imidazoleglycerol-phosphate dehydratase HisB [Nitrospirae bacterium]|nr:imidazoleglycerol-phosphate dehydratase HisB [Nitrospirota bacterium]